MPSARGAAASSTIRTCSWRVRLVAARARVGVLSWMNAYRVSRTARPLRRLTPQPSSGGASSTWDRVLNPNGHVVDTKDIESAEDAHAWFVDAKADNSELAGGWN